MLYVYVVVLYKIKVHGGSHQPLLASKSPSE